MCEQQKYSSFCFLFLVLVHINILTYTLRTKIYHFAQINAIVKSKYLKNIIYIDFLLQITVKALHFTIIYAYIRKKVNNYLVEILKCHTFAAK